MARKKEPFTTPLREDWAESILRAPSKAGEKTVYDRLAEARAELESAVAEAADALRTNALAHAVAAAASQEITRRGETSLFVSDDGVVMLHIAPYTRGGGRGWTSDLPTLGALRERALKIGIDPEPFGRSKRKLLDAIKEQEAKDKRPRKRIKTAPAVGPVTVVNPSSLPFGEPDPD